jgi:hypothetical protein
MALSDLRWIKGIKYTWNLRFILMSQLQVSVFRHSFQMFRSFILIGFVTVALLVHVSIPIPSLSSLNL